MSHISGSAATPRSTTRRPPAAGRPATLVWIDSRHAIVVRWSAGAAKVDRFESDVPAHRRTTGDGGCAPQPAVEGRRLEHLARFIDSIATRIRDGDDVLIMGPGTVHEQLCHELEYADRHARRQRRVACRIAGPLTERQLVAELRLAVGAPAPRKKQVRPSVRKPPAETLEDPFAELEPLAVDIDRS